MKADHISLVLLCLALTAAAVNGRAIDAGADAGRSLLQATTCSIGCATGKCVLVKTTGRYFCTGCVNGMSVFRTPDPSNTKHGTCGCSPGRYYATSTTLNPDMYNNRPTCTPCTRGKWCEGGSTTDANEKDCGFVPSGSSANNAASTPGLTTRARGGKSMWSCIEKPGYGYNIDTTKNVPVATLCAGDTYNAGLASQGCSACPVGFRIQAIASTDPADRNGFAKCKVPPGYFLRGPNEVALCPQGEYQDKWGPGSGTGQNLISKCTSCPAGVTTVAGKIATSAEFCNTLRPGWFAASANSVIAKNANLDTGGANFITLTSPTSRCPQKYWCPGGQPSAAYTDLADVPNLTTMRIGRCTTGNTLAAGTDTNPLWTMGQGATSKDECMVPPGHGTSTSSGDVTPCSTPNFREGWVRATSVNSHPCVACAQGGTEITSVANTPLDTFANLRTTALTQTMVPGTVGACKMAAGFGMYQSGGGFKSVACAKDNYGSSGDTFGRTSNPCRACPTNMVTPALASAAEGIKNIASSSATGFTSPLACQTKPGFGYDGTVSTACPAGSWNAGGNRDECTKCDYGYSTTTSAPDTEQNDAADCKVAPGFRRFTASSVTVVSQCPVGSWASNLRESAGNGNNADCTDCGNGRSTTDVGSVSDNDCELCSPGYGKTSTTVTDSCTDCGTVTSPAIPGYGPANRDSNACVPCPTQDIGFTFFYGDAAVPYYAAPVIKSAQTSAASCLSSFAQITSGLFFLSGAATPVNPANTLSDCAAACTGNCMFFTFNYGAADGLKCTLRNAAGSGKLLAFKTFPSGDVIGASSARLAAAGANVTQKSAPRSVASGLYTQWLETENAGDIARPIGDLYDPSFTPTDKAGCLSACDMDPVCVAAWIPKLSNTMATATLVSGDCKLVKGLSDPGKMTKDERASRSLTRAVVTQLT